MGRFRVNSTVLKIQKGDTILFFGPTKGYVPGFTSNLPEDKFYEFACFSSLKNRDTVFGRI